MCPSLFNPSVWSPVPYFLYLSHIPMSHHLPGKFGEFLWNGDQMAIKIVLGNQVSVSPVKSTFFLVLGCGRFFGIYICLLLHFSFPLKLNLKEWRCWQFLLEKGPLLLYVTNSQSEIYQWSHCQIRQALIFAHFESTFSTEGVSLALKPFSHEPFWNDSWPFSTFLSFSG